MSSARETCPSTREQGSPPVWVDKVLALFIFATQGGKVGAAVMWSPSKWGENGERAGEVGEGWVKRVQ